MVKEVSIKPYPSCHFAHGLIDCAKELRNDGLKPDDIKEILCYVDSVPISFICDPIDKKHNPKTDYEAKFSFAYLISYMFIDGKVNLNSYNKLNREEIVNFAKKIKYEKYISGGFPKYFCGKFKATLNNGSTIIKEVKINKGNPDNALSLDELLEKFNANVNDKNLSEKIKKQVLDLENIKSFE